MHIKHDELMARLWEILKHHGYPMGVHSSIQISSYYNQDYANPMPKLFITVIYVTVNPHKIITTTAESIEDIVINFEGAVIQEKNFIHNYN